MTTLLAFPASNQPWSAAERRVLDQLGKVVNQAAQCESGVTDEGDPWTAFFRSDDSFVAHVARIGARYVLVWSDGTSAHASSLDRLLMSARRRGAVAA